jgi:hypothetical protein
MPQNVIDPSLLRVHGLGRIRVVDAAPTERNDASEEE